MLNLRVLVHLLTCINFSTQVALNLQPLENAKDNCACDPNYQCKELRMNVSTRDFNPCPNYWEVCCKQPATNKPRINHQEACGYHRADGVGLRIITSEDNEAQFGEFPWMVAVLNGNRYQCGGALIHPKAVITAAHCVADKDKPFRIRAGEWDALTANEPYPHQNVDVEEVVLHPEFYPGGLFNDIAFLLLEHNVNITDYVDVVCLPPQSYHADFGRCYSTGWGKNVSGSEGKYQNILKKIDLFQVPRNECREKLRLTHLGERFKLHNSFICAGSELGKDACKGDGGGPLVCPVESGSDRYYQAGIVSWGVGCGDEGVPGVYVDVASFRNWIDKQMDLNNLEKSVYSYQ